LHQTILSNGIDYQYDASPAIALIINKQNHGVFLFVLEFINTRFILSRLSSLWTHSQIRSWNQSVLSKGYIVSCSIPRNEIEPTCLAIVRCLVCRENHLSKIINFPKFAQRKKLFWIITLPRRYVYFLDIGLIFKKKIHSCFKGV
jgi:hypothetical protein